LSSYQQSSSSIFEDNSSYQNTSNSLPKQSKSTNNIPTNDQDPNFESWLNNDKPKPKASTDNTRSSSSKKPSDKNQSIPPKPKEEPEPNLISFDDDKWMDDDDAGWESIDTK
jgi:hypothetical protein